MISKVCSTITVTNSISNIISTLATKFAEGVLFHTFILMLNLLFVFYLSPAPFPPSAVSVSQNGPGSIEVSWTPPSSGGPAVTSYKIHYKNDGGQRCSVSAEATTTTAVINGLITGKDYYITMESFSNNSSSTETTALMITMCEGMWYTNV